MRRGTPVTNRPLQKGRLRPHQRQKSDEASRNRNNTWSVKRNRYACIQTSVTWFSSSCRKSSRICLLAVEAGGCRSLVAGPVSLAEASPPHMDGASALMMKRQPAAEEQPHQVAWETEEAQTDRGEPRRASARGSARATGESARQIDAPLSARAQQATERLYSPPRNEPRRAVTLREITLRAGAALGSKITGSLKAEQMVEIIQKEYLANGTVRAKVGKRTEPRGLNVDPLGWATLRTDQVARRSRRCSLRCLLRCSLRCSHRPTVLPPLLPAATTPSSSPLSLSPLTRPCVTDHRMRSYSAS